MRLIINDITAAQSIKSILSPDEVYDILITNIEQVLVILSKYIIIYMNPITRS